MPHYLSKGIIDALKNLPQNKHFVIQKSDKGNSITVADREKCIKKTGNFSSYQSYFQKKTVNENDFLNAIISQVEQTSKIYKKPIY